MGLFISAISVLFMVAAVAMTNNGMNKASAMWLIMGYGVITIGELFLSPMGLSLVSKLSSYLNHFVNDGRMVCIYKYWK